MTEVVIAFVSVVGGAIIGFLIGKKIPQGAQQRSETPSMPADLHHTLELLRRAYGARVACLVQADGETVLASVQPQPAPEDIDRIVSVANLAMSDGRMHMVSDGETILALGDGTLGAALASTTDGLAEDALDAATADIRRIIAGLKVHLLHSQSAFSMGEGRDGSSVLHESVEGIALALAQAAKSLTDKPTAVVVRDRSTNRAVVESVAQGGDRRLLGLTIGVESAVGRACIGDAPIVGEGIEELFGLDKDNRRRNEMRGTAFPLRDGSEGVGALVVFGSIEQIEPATRERLMWLAMDTGPRIAGAVAIRAAELRAMTDDLTGLPNRRALERAMGSQSVGDPCALVIIDLDHFKQVNDTLGHAAGDAALKHVSRIFKSGLRDVDLAARIGGEEFALWLPGVNLEEAAEVAERARRNAELTPWSWAGSEMKISCSLGVASVPETVSQVANLYTTADAALYRAKGAGRNRVELAT